MNIVLVYPYHPVPFAGRTEPLGVQYLAAVVSGDHDVHIVDGFGRNLTAQQMLDECRQLKPDLIGIGVTHNPQVPVGLEFADLVKQHLPGVVIVWGGNYPTFAPHKFFSEGKADYIVKHEGEVTFSRLVNVLDQGRLPVDIPGLVCRDGDGRIVDYGLCGLIEDLDQLPVLEHNLPGYTEQYGIYAIMASRGCPFACINCSVSKYWRHRRRQRSVSHVMREVDGLIDRYGARTITFGDDLFTGKHKWVREFCTSVIDKYGERGLEWACNTRVDYLTEDLIELMGRAGCIRMFLGVESGSTRILRHLNKRYDANQALTMIKCCMANGIKPNASIMLGLPWETRDDLRLTLEFLDRAVTELPDAMFGIKHVTPIYGTDLYEQRDEIGVTLHNDDQYNLDLLVARLETKHLSLNDINEAYFQGRIMIGKRGQTASEHGDEELGS